MAIFKTFNICFFFGNWTFQECPDINYKYSNKIRNFSTFVIFINKLTEHSYSAINPTQKIIKIYLYFNSWQISDTWRPSLYWSRSRTSLQWLMILRTKWMTFYIFLAPRTRNFLGLLKIEKNLGNFGEIIKDLTLI